MGRRWGRVLMAAGLLAGWGSACNEGDTITAPTLSATCSATPSEGPAPLEVAFALDVSGAEGPLSVAINYGDGSTGSNPDAHHTYQAAGLYTASFTVTTETQSARCATTLEVAAGAATTPDGGDDGNLPPVIVYKTTPSAKGDRIEGTAPFTVKFNICLTHDPEGDTIFFVMNLDNAGRNEEAGTTGGSCRGEFTYAAGSWHARVCATDLDEEGARIHPLNCRLYDVIAN